MRLEFSYVALDGKDKRFDLLLLDFFSSNSLGSSYTRSKVKDQIISSSFSVNGTPIEKPSFKIKDRSLIRSSNTINHFISLNKAGYDSLKNSKADKQINQDDFFSVAFEDEDLIVINKNSGVSVHDGVNSKDLTIVDALVKKYGAENLSDIRGSIEQGIVHRLDKDTTGLMIVAKNNKSHIHLQRQIMLRICKRKYLAICLGMFVPTSGTIESKIKRSKDNYKKYITDDFIDGEGRSSTTYYSTKKVSKNRLISLVEFELETGRTHQIRVHSLFKNHPIVGDTLYKNNSSIMLNKLNDEKRKFYNSIKRQMLHAYKIEFIHPSTKKKISLEADMPIDMKYAIEELIS